MTTLNPPSQKPAQRGLRQIQNLTCLLRRKLAAFGKVTQDFIQLQLMSGFQAPFEP